MADINVKIKKRRWRYLSCVVRRDIENIDRRSDSTWKEEAWKTKWPMEDHHRKQDMTEITELQMRGADGETLLPTCIQKSFSIDLVKLCKPTIYFEQGNFLNH